MTQHPQFHIGKHRIGMSSPTYFVADIAANHDGDLARAKELIHLCAQHGANAAKFQNFFAHTIISDHGFRRLGQQVHHQARWTKSVFEVYKDASLPLEWTEELRKTCDEAGIDYFTAPYDLHAVETLEPYVCAWKLGSGDITWHDLIRRLASSDKPFLMATGASTLEEVKSAYSIAAELNPRIVLMQCNTNYTGSADNFHHVELRVIETYRELFPQTVLGLSDHTPGHSAVLGAVALGARVIEKHFTDDCGRNGPDHPFSMDCSAWKAMVDATRELEAALGTGEKRVMPNEQETVIIQRRAVRAKGDLEAGTILEPSHLCVLRPCPPGGLEPHRLSELRGRKLSRSIEAGACITLDDLET